MRTTLEAKATVQYPVGIMVVGCDDQYKPLRILGNEMGMKPTRLGAGTRINNRSSVHKSHNYHSISSYWKVYDQVGAGE